MLISFIPGKNISTKDILINSITCHFLVPDSFSPVDYLNRPLTLSLDGGVAMDCSISTEGSSYFYNGTHKTYAIKLDIVLPDIRAMGLIFAAKELNLEVSQ